MATAAGARGAGPERAFARPLPGAGRVRLAADEAHHLVRARRVAVGDRVVLFDGAGTTVDGILRAVDREGAEVEVLGPAPARAPARTVVVATAWPDGARADDLVAALAELGVAAVVPLRAARAQEDPAERVARRRERYHRLAVEAAKVSGAARLLEVEAPRRFDEVLAAAAAPGGGATVVLDTAPGLPTLPAAVGGATVVTVLVGPEGGFTDAEVAAAAAAGVARAGLGGLALRTETAAAAAAAILLGT